MQIAIGLSVTVPAAAPSGPSASVAITGLTDNPTHGLTAQIGVELTATATFTGDDPAGGTWGAPWTVDGVDFKIARYTPVTGDNLNSIAATFTAGDTYDPATSASYTARYAAPGTSGSIAAQDLVLTQAEVTVAADVAALFTGSDLTFGVSGYAGASLAAGALLVDPATSIAGATVTLTATNSGGSATQTFGLDVTALAFATGPSIAGTGKIGATHTATATANFAGTTIAYDWRRDGVSIGATDQATYVAQAADDEADLSCHVTLTKNGVSVAGTSSALAITYTAPTAINNLADQIETENTGAQTYDTSFAFSGSGIVYSLSANPAGVVINSGTGVVTINTDTTGILSLASVVVVATNSGGTVSRGFSLTVQEAVAATDVDFGALTLAGAGGVPVTGTSISSGDAGGHFEIVGGMLVPSATGAGNLSGTYNLVMDDASALTVTALADTYSARPTKAEMEAAVVHAAANRNALTTACHVRDEEGDAILALTQTFTGSFTFFAEGFTKNASTYPPDFTYGARIQAVDMEGGGIHFDGFEIYSPRSSSRAGSTGGLIKDTGRIDGASFTNCWLHSSHMGEWREAMFVASAGVADEDINLDTHLLQNTLVLATGLRHNIVARTGDYSRNITFEDCFIEHVRGFGEADVDNLFITGCAMQNFLSGFVGTVNPGPTGLKLHFNEFWGVWANRNDPGGSIWGIHSGLGGGSGVPSYTNQRASWIGNIVSTGNPAQQWDAAQGRDVSAWNFTGTTGVKFNDPISGQEDYSDGEFLGNIIHVASGIGFQFAHSRRWDVGWNTFLSGRGTYTGASVVQGGMPSLVPDLKAGAFEVQDINYHHNVCGAVGGGNHDEDLWTGYDFWENLVVLNADADPTGTTEGGHYDGMFVGDATKQLTFALTPQELRAAVALKPWTRGASVGIGAADNPYCTPGIAGKAAGHTFPTLSAPTTSGSPVATGHAYAGTIWDKTTGAELAQGTANGALQVSGVTVPGTKTFTVIFQGTFKDDVNSLMLVDTSGSDFRVSRNGSSGVSALQMTYDVDEATATSNSGNSVVYYSPRDLISEARGRVCALFSVDLDQQAITYWINGKSRQWHDYFTYFMNNLLAGIGQINMHLMETTTGTSRFDGELESLIIEDQFVSDADVIDFLAQDGFLRSPSDIETGFGRKPLVHFMGDKAALEAGTGNANGRAQAITLTGAGTVTDVTPADVTDPTITSYSPADNATDVATDATLSIVFNESMKTTGTAASVTLKNVGGATIETFDPDTDGAWTTTTNANDTWTVTPTSAFTNEADLAVQYSGFEDLAGNTVAAVANDTAWNFTVVAAAPSVTDIMAGVGDFSSATGWTVESGVEVTAGVARFNTAVNFVNLKRLGGSRVSCPAGETLSLEFTVAAFTSAARTAIAIRPYDSGGTALASAVTIYDTNTDGAITGTGTISKADVYTTPAGTTTLEVDFGAILAGSVYDIDDWKLTY